MINRVNWTSTKVENPNNSRPVTIILRDLKGSYTFGAYYNKETNKWHDMRSNEVLEGEIVCWADVEIPETVLFPNLKP
jgi:hypothetical protein